MNSPLYISAGYTVNVLPMMRMRRREEEIHREIAGLVPVIHAPLAKRIRPPATNRKTIRSNRIRGAPAPLVQLAETCGPEPQRSRFESGKVHDPFGSDVNETVLCISPQDIQSMSSP